MFMINTFDFKPQLMILSSKNLNFNEKKFYLIQFDETNIT